MTTGHTDTVLLLYCANRRGTRLRGDNQTGFAALVGNKRAVESSQESTTVLIAIKSLIYYTRNIVFCAKQRGSPSLTTRRRERTQSRESPPRF